VGIEQSIAVRFLKAKRRNSLVSLISVLAVGGVGLGVAALIVVLAVLDGFETNLKNKLLGLSAHVSVYRSGANITDWEEVTRAIKTVPGVRSALPFIQGQVMVSGGSGASGIVLIGLDPAASVSGGFFDPLNMSPEGVANLTQRPMKTPYPSFGEDEAEEEYLPEDPPEVGPQAGPEAAGSSEGLSEGLLSSEAGLESETQAGGEEEEPERPILVGRELGYILGVGVLSPVRVISPFGRVTPIGQRSPLTRFFKVAGTFQANYYDYDSKLAFTTIDEAQSILGLKPGEVSFIEVKVDDIYRADRIHQAIIDVLGPDYWGRDWMQMNLSLFSALKLEQAAMFVCLTLIILVAAFNIASTLIMMVTEKTRDIAILKAMGATSRQIRKIFTLQGLLVGAVGTLGGLIVGVSLCLILERYEFISLPPEIYLTNTLPVELRWPQVAAITVVSMLISYLATVYPAKQAAGFDPVEAIRYE
jgi:lipoprotein-releasing system permease protein